jgi:hypothetical protein
MPLLLRKWVSVVLSLAGFPQVAPPVVPTPTPRCRTGSTWGPSSGGLLSLHWPEGRSECTAVPPPCGLIEWLPHCHVTEPRVGTVTLVWESTLEEYPRFFILLLDFTPPYMGSPVLCRLYPQAPSSLSASHAHLIAGYVLFSIARRTLLRRRGPGPAEGSSEEDALAAPLDDWADEMLSDSPLCSTAQHRASSACAQAPSLRANSN